MNGAAVKETLISDKMQMTWPIVLTMIGATWWMGTTLTEIRSQLATLVSQGTVHDGRIRAIEEAQAERGPRLKAIEEAIRNR